MRKERMTQEEYAEAKREIERIKTEIEKLRAEKNKLIKKIILSGGGIDTEPILDCVRGKW